MKRIQTLDGLRGIAILLVISGHVWHAYGATSGIASRLAGIFANSGLGVRLFFVLSGYLISSLLLKEVAAAGTISLKNFYIRRALRIFPAFYTFIACVLGLALAGAISVSTNQLLAAASYTWNYGLLWPGHGTAEGGWFLGHLWTLSLEEQFYLFWPAVLLLLGAKRSLKLALCLTALMPVIRVSSYFLFPSQRGYLGMMLHTAIDSIMAGCVLALVANDARLQKWAGGANWRPAVGVALAFVFIMSPLASEFLHGAYDITVGISLDAICVAILIYDLTRHPDDILGRLLSWAPLVFVGRLSYSWYLWQQLFLTTYNRTWSGAFPVSILCSFLAALASHYLIERPFLTLKTRFAGGEKRPRQGDTAPSLR